MSSTTTRPVVPFDVCDPAFYLDPWESYAWLREHAPLGWDERNGIWVASTYEGVFEISRQPERFCSGGGIRPLGSLDLSLIGLDGDEHTRQRRLINKGFTPRTVGRLEEHIREVTDEVIDGIDGRATGDFVPDIAIHVPLVVIAELMGLPVEDRDRFWHWSDDMMAGEGADGRDVERVERAATAFTEYTTYAAALVEERRAEYRSAKAAEARGETVAALRDDLISVLVAAHEEGALQSHLHANLTERLEEGELLMFLVLLVVAGNETTRNAMSGGLVAFSEHPDQWRRFVEHVDDPVYTARAAEEVIRWVSPVLNFARTATADTELLGQQVREGEKVLMLYQSANRDAAAFDAPDEFRIERDDNPHLAFGIGPHFCLGANLARLEIRVLFEQLARRLPGIRMTPGASPVYAGTNTLVRGIDSIPVTYADAVGS
jgi:cytochrome P450